MGQLEQIKNELERRIQSAIHDMASPDIKQVEKGQIKANVLRSFLSFVESVEKEEPNLPIRDLIYQEGWRDGWGECMANVSKSLAEVEAKRANPIVVVKDFKGLPVIKG